jgi:voltage-gated sodium channel
MQAMLARVARSPWFQNTITVVILLAGVLVGVETYPSMVHAYGHALHAIDQLILAVFVVEIVVKMGAHGNRPWRYFLDPWNVFDFAIVAVCFMPFDAQGVAVLRLARLLRVLKLVRALPKLQVLVSALLKSIPSMGYISLLLFMMFYLYAVAATTFFGANDPVHFGTLQISMVSLFRTVTLESWTSLMYTQMYGCAEFGYGDHPELCTASTAQPGLAVAFFVSFVLLGTMVILNLFVGVIMTGMAEAQAEQRDLERAERAGQAATIEMELDTLHEQLAQIQEQLGRIQRLANRGKPQGPAPSSK